MRQCGKQQTPQRPFVPAPLQHVESPTVTSTCRPSPSSPCDRHTEMPKGLTASPTIVLGSSPTGVVFDSANFDDADISSAAGSSCSPSTRGAGAGGRLATLPRWSARNGITAHQFVLALDNMTRAWSATRPDRRFRAKHGSWPEAFFDEDALSRCCELIQRWHSGKSSHPDSADLAKQYPYSEAGARRLLEDLQGLRGQQTVQAAEVRLWTAKFARGDSPSALRATAASSSQVVPPAPPSPPARPAPPAFTLQSRAARSPAAKSVKLDVAPSAPATNPPPTRLSACKSVGLIDTIDRAFQSMITDLDEADAHVPLSPAGWRARIQA
jgi:hypothetical protein